MKPLRILVVEDEFIGRKILLSYLQPLGPCDVAVNGSEAVEAARLALENNTPYELICMDIKMPGMDGQAALAEIRRLESAHGIDPGDGARVIMTTAVDDPKTIMQSFKDQCEAYLVKPIQIKDLMSQLRKLGFDVDMWQ